MTRRLAIIISLLVGVVTALDHFHGYDAYLLKLNTTTPILSMPAASQAKPLAGPQTKKLTFVLLDGLGYESSLALPAFQENQARAVWFPLLVEFPSYTYPGIVAYATGVPPRYSGLRLNHTEHLSHISAHGALPTILDEAASMGLSVQIDNGDWSEFSDLLDFQKKLPRRPGNDADFTFMYFGAIDAAGHAHGGDSAQYRSAALQASEKIEKLIKSTDLSRETIVVVSDHGHLPQGGHGGVEPSVTHATFFAIGAGIEPSRSFTEPVEVNANDGGASYLDVVPTVAALLGIPNPPANLGRPLLDILSASQEEKAKILYGTIHQRALVEGVMTTGVVAPAALLERLRAGDATAIEPAERWLQDTMQRREESYVQRRNALSMARLWWALALTALLLAAIVVLQYKKHLALRVEDLLPTILYTVVYMAVYHLAGYGVSWSLPRGEPGFMIETLLAGALGVSLSFWVSRRRNGFTRIGEETLCMGLLFSLPYLWASAWVGLDPIYLSDPFTSFWVIFLATIGFYAHGPYGTYLLWRALRRKAPFS